MSLPLYSCMHLIQEIVHIVGHNKLDQTLRILCGHLLSKPPACVCTKMNILFLRRFCILSRRPGKCFWKDRQRQGNWTSSKGIIPFPILSFPTVLYRNYYKGFQKHLVHAICTYVLSHPKFSHDTLIRNINSQWRNPPPTPISVQKAFVLSIDGRGEKQGSRSECSRLKSQLGAICPPFINCLWFIAARINI